MRPPIKGLTQMDLSRAGTSEKISDVVLISVDRDLAPAAEYEPKQGEYGAVPGVRSMKEFAASDADAEDPGRWASYALQMGSDQLLMQGQRASAIFAKFGEGRGALFVHLVENKDGCLVAPAPGEPGHMVVRQSFGGHFVVESRRAAGQGDRAAHPPKLEELAGKIARQRELPDDPDHGVVQKPGCGK